jgi:hypothetical protein
MPRIFLMPDQQGQFCTPIAAAAFAGPDKSFAGSKNFAKPANMGRI